VAELFWDSFRAMSASIESGSSFNPQIFIKSSARILFQGRHGICAGTSVTRRISMKFSFEVGELEKHRVEFNFNQLCGTLLIRVDNKPVHRATRLLNEPVHEVFDFMVGDAERWPVRIEKRRKPLFGSRNVLYVNHRLTRVVEGF
jgi:hypothetical protein